MNINSYCCIIIILKVCPKVCSLVCPNKGKNMAVDRKQFIHKVDTGLKANSDYTKFYINYKLDGKVKQKVLNYIGKDWDKRTRISKAKADLLAERNKQVETSLGFTENTSLNNLAKLYFDNTYGDTAWAHELISVYKLYCSTSIGTKKIKDIRTIHIDNLRKSMEIKGHSKQTENGCSPRTIKKVLHQILRPILEYAVENKVLDSVPTIKIPRQTRQKKLVSDAGVKFKKLHRVISELYKDNGFYRALFLFALQGRRWNEIRTLKWSDMDFESNKYTIRAENNKINRDQTYQLLEQMKTALNGILDTKKGLVFKSPVTGKELYPPKRQLQRIKEKANIPELTMHYFRHILVSAMGEIGVAGTVLSASLGHASLNTVNRFYLSVDHIKSSQIANEAIEKLIKGKIIWNKSNSHENN